nr:hypothetical protein [Pirellula staleyi]
MNDSSARSMTHNELVDACVDAAEALDRIDVARAFIASLSSRRLDWRGVLPAYAVCRQLPRHEYAPTQVFQAGPDASCFICGLPSPSKTKVSGRLLVGNLGRAYYLETSLTTLQQFASTEKPVPKDEDFGMLTETLNRLQNRNGAKLGELQKLIQGLFPSNKFEREDFLGALAIAGIFQLDAASYFDGWVTYDIRESVMPSHFYAKDSSHPLRHYKPDCGLNERAISFWFKDLHNSN